MPRWHVPEASEAQSQQPAPFVQEPVVAGEVVTFRIADNLLAAKQAEKLGAPVSRLIGTASPQNHPQPQHHFSSTPQMGRAS